MTDAERSRRYRALKKVRRKEGKAAAARRRQALLENERYVLFSPLHEVASRSCRRTSSNFIITRTDPELDKRLDDEQVKREKLELDGLLDYLAALEPRGRPPVPPSVRHGFVRRFILERFASALAAEEAAVRRSGNARSMGVHFARRVLAGWGQLLDLWEAGEDDAFMDASERGLLVLRGATYVAELIQSWNEMS